MASRLFGLSGSERIKASKEASAICPLCKEDLVPKCGDIKQWHWAHKANNCDPWSEGESDWHLGWKSHAWPECQEVIVGNHRADIKSKAGLVVELQHSGITAQEIAEREANKKEPVILALRKCENCGKEFVPNFARHMGKYCSKTCAGFARHKAKHCKVCGNFKRHGPALFDGHCSERCQIVTRSKDTPK